MFLIHIFSNILRYVLFDIFQTYIDCLSIFYLEVGFALWYVSNSYLLKPTSVTLIYFSLSLLHTSLGHILTTFSRYGISYFIVCQTYFCDFGMFRYVADLEFLRHISPTFSRYGMSYSIICQAYFLDIFLTTLFRWGASDMSLFPAWHIPGILIIGMSTYSW